MKNLITFIAAVVLVAVTATVNAQVTGTATGSATIIAPIAIANAGNMNFGSIAESSVKSASREDYIKSLYSDVFAYTKSFEATKSRAISLEISNPAIFQNWFTGFPKVS